MRLLFSRLSTLSFAPVPIYILSVFSIRVSGFSNSEGRNFLSTVFRILSVRVVAYITASRHGTLHTESQKPQPHSTTESLWQFTQTISRAAARRLLGGHKRARHRVEASRGQRARTQESEDIFPGNFVCKDTFFLFEHLRPRLLVTTNANHRTQKSLSSQIHATRGLKRMHNRCADTAAVLIPRSQAGSGWCRCEPRTPDRARRGPSHPGRTASCG